MCAAAAKRRDMLLTDVVTRERMFVDTGSRRIVQRSGSMVHSCMIVDMEMEILAAW